uniref:Transient receptor potential cation channel, subfamily M, member 2 n=1 Tax=Poecilia formosa TaxID=48698 RepID=A0A087YKX8_POEFO
SKEEVCCEYSNTDNTDEVVHNEQHSHRVPTDAFGDVSFGGSWQKTGKYVRVFTDTKPEVLYELLTTQWELPRPNLLISVTGGAKNFYLKSNLKKAFHRGLIKVAQTTGAWIITGGTNAGVMRHVGQAVRDYALSNTKQREIVAIGVAPWRVIHNRDKLVNEEGCFPAQYVIDKQGQGNMACLDDNHSHFLLVDDGTSDKNAYGAEIPLRTQLEQYISDQTLGNKATTIKTPVVCVALDGGYGTLKTVHQAITKGIPCVILEGSGRIADVIARVFKQRNTSTTDIDDFNDLIDKQMNKFLEETVAYRVEDVLKRCLCWLIQEIVQKPELLTIFRAGKDELGVLDVAILDALFKASKTSESQEDNSWKKQLKLAIDWNRVNSAETEIFTEDRQWTSSDLHWAMTSALVGNKPDFVSLLLEYGVCLEDFLDEATLCELYQKLPNCFFLYKLFNAIRSESDTLFPFRWLRLQLWHSGSNDATRDRGAARNLGPLLKIPIQTDLFLWAVVQNNKELSKIAWDQCGDCISAALAASKILKKMAEESIDADEPQEMLELASHFEDRAIGVFSKCYKNDEERAQKLLVRISSLWGKTTCLRLALEADNKKFVAELGVQDLLTQIWCGELSVHNPVWRVLVCMVFFPLIYTKFLVFSKQSGKCPNCLSRLLGLYCAPQVKFYGNIVSYFAFLFLFAYVLMVDFQRTPSIAELVLYFWLFTLVSEEIRQNKYLMIIKKAKVYIQELWNILDVISILLFCLGLAFRLTTKLLYPGKIILCIDFVVFCLRLMAIFTINRTLGPKIIIVKKMMRDLFFFMFLLSIWVVAYGVAKQGILIENDNRLDWIMRGAIYEPYLVIFGNFPENIDNAKFDMNSCSMNGTDPLKPKCPVLNEKEMPVFPEWITIVMLCVYLLFANILLINLLIAIFNYTFEEVHDNTDRIWKFQRYQLIKEYYSRPAPPPPFIILSHLYLFIRKLVLWNAPKFQTAFSKALVPDF